MIDTTSTYRAAYVLVAIIYLGYSISLWVRARRLRERLSAQSAEPGAE